MDPQDRLFALGAGLVLAGLVLAMFFFGHGAAVVTVGCVILLLSRI